MKKVFIIYIWNPDDNAPTQLFGVYDNMEMFEYDLKLLELDFNIKDFEIIEVELNKSNLI